MIAALMGIASEVAGAEEKTNSTAPEVQQKSDGVRKVVRTLLLAPRKISGLGPHPQPPLCAACNENLDDADDLPKPHEPICDIMEKLPTLEKFLAFVEKYIECKNPESVYAWLVAYGDTPECLQKRNWNGCCNALAELSAWWAYAHGGKPYLVTLRPREFIGPWHQITVCKMNSGELIIFDNTEVYRWKTGFRAYMEEHYRKMTIAELGGVIKWENSGETLFGNIGQHVCENTCNLETADLPGCDKGCFAEESAVQSEPDSEPRIKSMRDKPKVQFWMESRHQHTRSHVRSRNRETRRNLFLPQHRK